MRCSNCPMFVSWNNESDSGEACGIFGDGWDSPFQYEDKKGLEIIGCYLEKAYINKVDNERCKQYEQEAKYATELMEKEFEEWLKSEVKE